MSRRSYETEDQVRAEREFVNGVVEQSEDRLVFNKVGKFGRCDYVLVGGSDSIARADSDTDRGSDNVQLISLVEVKIRNHAYGTYPTLFFSHKKYEALNELARLLRCCWLVLVRYNDGDYYYVHLLNDDLQSSYGGRRVMRDSADRELLINVPIELIKPLTPDWFNDVKEFKKNQRKRRSARNRADKKREG